MIPASEAVVVRASEWPRCGLGTGEGLWLYTSFSGSLNSNGASAGLAAGSALEHERNLNCDNAVPGTVGAQLQAPLNPARDRGAGHGAWKAVDAGATHQDGVEADT